MAEKKREYKDFPGKIKIADYTTPVGVAVYPHLIKADTKWKPEGEYRTKLRYNAERAAPIQARMEDALDEAFASYKDLLLQFNKKGKALVKTVSKAKLPIQPETDEEGDETGDFLLNTKRVASGTKKDGTPWKAKVVIADIKGVTVPTKNLSIWSGSELRVAGQIMGWYNAKDNEVGVSLEIAGVQIKKLVSGGDRDVSFEAMDDDDGEGFDASSLVQKSDPDDVNDDDDADTDGDASTDNDDF